MQDPDAALWPFTHGGYNPSQFVETSSLALVELLPDGMAFGRAAIASGARRDMFNPAAKRRIVKPVVT